LLIETKGKRILTDPGSYSVETHSKIKNLDYVLFTHEHQDHFHLVSLKKVVSNNPNVVIHANTSVSKLLSAEKIEHVLIKHLDKADLGGISLVGIGEKHAVVHTAIPVSENTGFFIDGRLWYPGDSFTNPERPIEILALPVTGPWLRISDSVDYALELQPKVAFPVHDFKRSGLDHRIPAELLPPQGIAFIPFIEGETREF
jgi:L-ascorbate metabolism protein UlaG (beta-lactamase superfamily)